MGWYGFSVLGTNATVNDVTPEVFVYAPLQVVRKPSNAHTIAVKAFEANKEFAWGSLAKQGSSFENFVWRLYPIGYKARHRENHPDVVYNPKTENVFVIAKAGRSGKREERIL